MNCQSIFEIFKIGIGPSSSHTMGPWFAAQSFIAELKDLKLFEKVESVNIHLYGSLAKTGKGHATDMAVILGLSGYDIIEIKSQQIPSILSKTKEDRQISLGGEKRISFQAEKNISFHKDKSLDYHPNGISFKAFHKTDLLLEQTYFSMGGGFIEQEGEQENREDQNSKLAFQIDAADDLIQVNKLENYSIAEIVSINEKSLDPSFDCDAQLDKIWDEMLNCIYLGCYIGGELPGPLGVKRRAKELNAKLLQTSEEFTHRDEWIKAIKGSKQDFNSISKWISCFALAVNEENASLGKVVTAPTNGAAGVIPAVLMYYYCFEENVGQEAIRNFLKVAGQIGVLFKNGATISAAMGGCQAEIGVSSSMAAAALTECRGGSLQQSLMASEIAMEHHLGMTCDPIGGLVQIPCIERNAMGAIKAITASNMALESNPNHAKVSLDQVIKTMWETAQDMNTKYKETSEGGLASQIPVNIPDC